MSKKILCVVILALFAFMVIAPGAHAQSGITPIEGISLSVGMAKYDPAPAQAGDFVTVWFDVTNRGNQFAENVSFELVAKYPFSLPDNNPVQKIDFLGGLSFKRLEYRMIIAKDAPDGISEIEVNYNTGNAVKLNKKFNITVNNTVYTSNLHALFVSASPVAVPGEETNMSIDVVNADKGTAFYVIAKAETPAAAIERNEIFIGTLEPNDFDNIDFKLMIPQETAPGTYPVTLTFYYRDKDSKLFTETDAVNINVVPKSSVLQSAPAIAPYMYAMYIIVILIVIRLLIPLGKWFIKPFRKKKH
jgi:hypothetical protein